uniref:Uncharacterized protein TCIL3000_3_2780 n=1 Tax=Trypanosoma congolense (strain IL3000) TaxID=1068625 RepID=G0UKE0_TRYCI|nr:unnamed protein product [Trypanosoma congolense IL3000]
MSSGNSPSLKAIDVVSASENTAYRMQFPSPVYFTRWIDERHAVVGAGGGGRRFGMANLLVIVAIDTTRKRADNASGVGQEDASALRPWCFVTAIDMESDIPWCASSFLPCTEAAQGADGVIGYLAISHITSFTLIDVRRDPETKTLTLRKHARVDLPSDQRNPDKKPIALVQGALVVAHDEEGVLVYELSSLLRRRSPDNSGETVNGHDSEARSRDGEVLTAGEECSPVVVSVEPWAKWSLPGRVNDLHANRFFVPKRSISKEGAERHHHHYSNYLLIAAIVQDKTLRLSVMKMQKRGKATSESVSEVFGSPDGKKGFGGGWDEAKPITAVIEDACVLTGRDCRIPFSMMKSSMRLVQLFGVENVEPSRSHTLWKAARRLHCEQSIRGEMPVAGIVLVAFDVVSNQSYMLSAQVVSTSASRDEGLTPSSSDHAPFDLEEQHSVRSTGKKRLKRLALRVHFALEPSPVVKDGVTSISPCHYYQGRAEGCVERGEGVGTAIPSRWLVGTVEGTLVAVSYSADGRFQAQRSRPSKERSEANFIPALHKEPISSLAVSRLNDVLSSDIAQNVVVSVLPQYRSREGRSSLGLDSEGNAHLVASVGSIRGREVEGGAEEAGTEEQLVLKDVSLLLFPTFKGSRWLLCLKSKNLLSSGSLLALSVIPLMGIVIALVFALLM